MPAVLFESAVRAALIALAVWLVFRALKIKTANMRHSAWIAVAAVMLVLPALVVWGPRAPIRVLPARSITPEPAIDAPGPFILESAREVAADFPDWTIYVLVIYLVGLTALLVRLAIGTLRVRRLVREAELQDGMLTHPSCVTPITVGWFRPKVILPVDWSSWPEGLRHAVLAHENHHIRRRDPLFQWLALLNRAAFWFHPLAWWLERRVSELAEEACDAAVLEWGHDPGDYGEYLLDLARTVQRAGTTVHALGLAMPGIGLGRRIRQVLDGPRAPGITSLRRTAALLLCAAAAVTLSAARLDHALPSPSFDTATIEPADPDFAGRSFLTPGPGRFRVTNMPVTEMIRFAYAEDFTSNLEITGGPGWIAGDRYNVEARAEGNPTLSEFRLMLRSLLVDRFAVRLHSGAKETDIYALVLSRGDGKPGPKVEPWDGTCNGQEPPPSQPNAKGPRCSAFFLPPGMVLVGASMDVVADMLSTPVANLDRRVVDRTGLRGEFNMDFEFKFRRPGDPRAGEGPSLRAALEEQFGLKLEPARGTADVLVVDRAERPAEN